MHQENWSHELSVIELVTDDDLVVRVVQVVRVVRVTLKPVLCMDVKAGYARELVLLTTSIDSRNVGR